MSTILNRSTSMSPNDLPSYSTPSKTENGAGDGPSESPLKIFVVAKRKINDIFAKVNDYVEASKSFLAAQPGEVCPEDHVSKVNSFSDRVTGIRDVLKRDHMKVAFFGRTSNGKSTVINALLHNKILPSGMGHTTNCFLQVEGSDNNEGYMIVDDNPDEILNIESVSEIANALMSERLGDATLVRIFWPKNMCSLLRDDVVLMDSPGIDVSANLDEWIDKHCLDADVFVLVSNSESTLMRTEKAFFHKVSERLSKPNIFILNNRWDAAASEPEYLDKVRKQHTDRDIAFLCDELNVVSRAEAENRVFFVSAKEVLQNRAKNSFGSPANFGLAEGFQHRFYEFETFERKFEECLSQSAVKTKFDQHAKGGKKITTELANLLDYLYMTSSKIKQEKLSYRKQRFEKLEFTQKQMDLITSQVKHQICNLVEKVELKVGSALNEEIRRLSLLVNDFEKPFNSDALFLSVYKKDLHMHVEKGLGSNLRARLSTALSGIVESAQKEMIERVSSLLPENEKRKQYIFNMNPRQNFEILYRINCESLCSDFQEDLEFRFSFGLLSMIKRFRGGFRKGTISKSLPPTAPQTPSNDVKALSTNTNSELYSMIERLSIIAPQSQTTVGALALGGFMVRTIGWRIIAITCGVYTLLYVYERLTWTNKAKERSFKKQYVNHATRKLKLIVDLTSANCSHQVQQELTATYARLCHLTDDCVTEMQNEILDLDKNIEKLETCSNGSRTLKNRASLLTADIDDFSNKFLNYNS